MSDNIKELLDEAIRQEILNLGTLEIASEAKGAAVDDVVKLYKLRIEETKNEAEIREKREARIMENEREERTKQAQQSDAVIDRYFKIGLAAAELALPLTFYGVWMHRGFKFEQTGTYTSKTFMGLINRFKPTKK
jgi:hypothetical protein